MIYVTTLSDCIVLNGRMVQGLLNNYVETILKEKVVA